MTTPHWDPVVTAYEANREALEAAREAYLGASETLLNAINDGLHHKTPDWKRRGYTVTTEVAEYDNGTPELRATVEGAEDISATLDIWVGSNLGGPAGSLRFGVRVDLPTQLFPNDLMSLVSDLRTARVAPAVGEAFDPLQHSEFEPQELWFWADSLPLADAPLKTLVKAGVERAVTLLEQAAVPMVTTLQEWAEPNLRFSRALEQARTAVQQLARQHDWELSPARSALGRWANGNCRYLQIHDFWLCCDLRTRSIMAAGQGPGRDTVERRASQLGRPVVPLENTVAYQVLDDAGIDGDALVQQLVSEFGALANVAIAQA